MFDTMVSLATGTAEVIGLTTETLNGILDRAKKAVNIADKIKILLEKINISFCILVPTKEGKYKIDYCTDVSALRTKIFCDMDRDDVTHCIVWLIDNRYIKSLWDGQELKYSSWRSKFMQVPYSRFLGVFNKKKYSEEYDVDREVYDLLLERAKIFIEDIAHALVVKKPLWCSADCSKWETQFIYAPITGSKPYNYSHVYPGYDNYMDIRMLHGAVGYGNE